MNDEPLGARWLVVGCTTAAYAACNTLLTLTTAVELQPLSATQIASTLASADSATAGRQADLQEYPHRGVVLDTPLALTLAVHGSAGNTGSQMVWPDASDHWQMAYRVLVPQLFRAASRRQQMRCRRTLRQLRQLAWQLRQDHVTSFVLDDLSPGWLRHPWVFRLLSGLGCGLMMALVGGMTFRHMFDPVTGGMLALILGIGSGSIAGLRAGRSPMVDVRQWSWRAVMISRAQIFRFTLLGAMGVGVSMGVSSVLLVALTHPSLLVATTGFLIVAGGIGGVFGGLLAGLYAGFNAGLAAAIKPRLQRPNAGIHGAFRHGVIQAGLMGLSFILSYDWGCVFIGGLLVPSEGRIGLGLIFGLGSGLGGGVGVALKHYLLRVLLWLQGTLPLQVVRLLEAGCRLHILRRQGGTYEFWHPTLRDYLADLSDDQIDQIAQAVTPQH